MYALTRRGTWRLDRSDHLADPGEKVWHTKDGITVMIDSPDPDTLYAQYEQEALRFAASRYQIPPHLRGMMTMDDLYQEARIGLMNASRRYDPNGLHRDRDFPTVMRFAIRHQLRKALQLDERPGADISEQPTQPLPLIAVNVSPLVPPTWLIEDRYQTRELPALGPSVEEQVMAAVDGAQISATLEAALLLLSERQRAIIERRYGLTGDGVCWTLEEVGRLLGRN